jgi:hypothetical protein
MGELTKEQQAAIDAQPIQCLFHDTKLAQTKHQVDNVEGFPGLTFGLCKHCAWKKKVDRKFHSKIVAKLNMVLAQIKKGEADVRNTQVERSGVPAGPHAENSDDKRGS